MKIYQVNAFSDRIGAGNPAGVVVLDSFPNEQLMQNIATEMNLSETAFVVPNKGDFSIRFFTPMSEVDLCGHATLASAHILLEMGIVKQEGIITFQAKKDTLSVKKSGEYLVLDFPTFPLQQKEIPENFQEVTGIFGAIEYYETDKDIKIIVLENESQIYEAKPKFNSMQGTKLGKIVITAKSSGKYDYIMRFFVPDFGIDEDPVTGISECALAPLWSQKLGKKEFSVFQASKRSGEKHVETKNLSSLFPNNRVEIGGKAITVFEIESRF